jgi:cell division protein FtsI (penicillin-binding protein 3)
METKTGKVKAIANLGKMSDGTYFENFNYAINPTEPGSTFKLTTLIALLEDKKVSLNTKVNLEGGVWKVYDRTVFDSEQHGRKDVTVQEAFELSSNVGMAKLALNSYGNNPSQFIHHLHQLKLDTLTGIDLTGERNAVIIKPGTKLWSATTLPWMAFGYNIEVTPLQILTLYNAVANNGTMVKPYLVNAIKQEAETIKVIKPIIIDEKICSDATLIQVKKCLEGVCINGTAKKLFQNSAYKVAGKTGTALVADGKRGYTDKIYQSSFAGYFPADDPQYTCIVVIKNKPQAIKFYGADVAGVVFKEIADRLFTTHVHHKVIKEDSKKYDSTNYSYVGAKTEIKQVLKQLNIQYKDSSTITDEWVTVTSENSKKILTSKNTNTQFMPLLKGLGLKDAISICENLGLKILVKGKGKVAEQSIAVGEAFAKGQLINIALN